MNVFREEIPRQTNLRRISDLDNFLLSLEFEETCEDYEGGDLDLIKTELKADPNNLLKHWKLYCVALSNEHTLPWTLEFEVTWDPEHTRSAFFNSEVCLVDYQLSSSVFDEDVE